MAADRQGWMTFLTLVEEVLTSFTWVKAEVLHSNLTERHYSICTNVNLKNDSSPNFIGV